MITIVTRTMKGREIRLKQMIDSLKSQTSNNYQHLILNDNIGLGMLEANKSFFNNKEKVKGDYIHLLDDDDFYCSSDFIKDISDIAYYNEPDVIIFKMIIKIPNAPIGYDFVFPKCWNKSPERAKIGGSCFVVSNRIYQKYIHHFGVYPMGDFNFINEVWKEPNLKVIWQDKIYCETGIVSRGKIL